MAFPIIPFDPNDFATAQVDAQSLQDLQQFMWYCFVRQPGLVASFNLDRHGADGMKQNKS